MHSSLLWTFILSVALFSSDSFAGRRGRFFGHQGGMSRFNSCGMGSCRSGRSSFRTTRRFGRGGFFSRMRNRFPRSRMSRPGCGGGGGGSCSPRLPSQPGLQSAPGAPQRDFLPQQHPDIAPQSQQFQDDDAAPAPGIGQDSRAEIVNRVELGAQVFKARCEECHAPGESPGPIKDFSRAISRVIKGEMPADDTPRITGEDLENLKAFLESKKQN